MANYLLLASLTVVLAVGQMLFKHVGLAMRDQSVLDGFLAIARMPVLYAALGLYAAATLVWIWVLSRVPLSQAYPWVAISVGAVPLLAWLVFHERLTSGYWIGLGFIVVGVFLTQYPPPNP